MSYLVEKMKSIETQVSRAVEEMAAIKKQLVGYHLGEGTLKSEPLKSQALNEADCEHCSGNLERDKKINELTNELARCTGKLASTQFQLESIQNLRKEEELSRTYDKAAIRSLRSENEKLQQELKAADPEPVRRLLRELDNFSRDFDTKNKEILELGKVITKMKEERVKKEQPKTKRKQ